MAKRRARKPVRTLSLRQLFAAAPLVLIFAVAFAVAVQVSAAGEFRPRAPQLALRFMPVDAEARARLASVLAANNPLPEARQAARDLAFDALRRDPLSPIALRALGQARATEGTAPADLADAAKLFHGAEKLSRRDHVTQLWLAEYYLRRDQIPQVLRHFDIALRTSASGQDTLFPLLGTAAADPRVASALASRIREKPHWALAFVNHLTGGQASPEAASYIIRNSLDPKVPQEMALIEAMMQRFAAMGEYRYARELYDHFKLARARGNNLLNDGGFESHEGVTPFAWSIVEEADLWAAPEPIAKRGSALVLSASGGRSGDLARQLVQLPAASYRLSATFGNVPSESYLRPTLSVRCATGSKTGLIALRPSRAGSGAQTATASFSVPAACGYQWILISLTGPETDAVQLPWIDDVAIIPIGS